MVRPFRSSGLQTLALSAWFGRSGEPVNQAQLAAFGGIHPMQMSHILKTLESKKFIARRRSCSDTRAKQVTVTRRGLSTLRNALPLVIAVQSRLFGNEGRPGGTFLATLVDLDRKSGSADED